MERFLDKAGLERAAGHLNSKLAAKQDKLAGKPGQVVGFDETGQAVAQEMPDGGSGTSPYEYAVAGGYKGTEEEFQAALAAGPWIPAAGRLLEHGSEAFNDVEHHVVTGLFSHVEGSGHGEIMGDCVHVEGIENGVTIIMDDDSPTVTDSPSFGVATHVEGRSNLVQFYNSASEGNHIEGLGCQIFDDATAGGYSEDFYYFPSIRDTSCNHLEGRQNCLYHTVGCHVEGDYNRIVNADFSHVSGRDNRVQFAGSAAPGSCVFVHGAYNRISGRVNVNEPPVLIGQNNDIAPSTQDDSVPLYHPVLLLGSYLKIDERTDLENALVIVGGYNNPAQTDGRLIVGGGNSDNDRSNCFRVTPTTVFGGTYKSSGADYAELFAWLDGNPEGEDRVGRFVTLEGDKLRLAGPGDGFVLGIVSGNPSIVGDVYDDQWQGMYLCDVFGRPVWEDIEVPEETEEIPDPDNPGQTRTVVKTPAHMERRQKLNPAYDHTQQYSPRSERPEWDAVGMMGKLVAVDDGSCRVNGWCTAGEGGAATHSDGQTRYRVMARLDEGHVQVLVV